MKLINFIDENVDGCGTDVEMLVQIEDDLTGEVVEKIRNEVDSYKNENPEEWDSDSIFAIALECLEKNGYSYQVISSDYEITL